MNLINLSMVDNSSALNETYIEQEHSKLTMAILGVIYSLIFLIGISGNSLVIITIINIRLNSIYYS